ncbi:MAG TPA: AraC family transcriptional regulator [Polyangiaceae bacterium]|nr:AraC family transcriptional regulator [Polyangiaceae bacterium]
MMGDELRQGVEFGRNEASSGREVVTFHRRRELAGVEIRSLKNSASAFRCYSTDFELFAPISWRGEIWHRRRQALIGPGTVLCARPGDVFFSQRVTTPGAANFLAIDTRVFHEYLSDHSLAARQMQLRAFTRISKRLEEKLQQVCRVVRPGPSALELQTAMVEFINALVPELLESPSDSATSLDATQRTAERVRDCLHGDVSATVDLSTLAKHTGVSRFQVLRIFKLRYGLPPHTYQLNVRLAFARKALRAGQLPAEVAAQYGFFDQSHLTRHFKRLLGVTPAQYARIGARSRASRAD